MGSFDFAQQAEEENELRKKQEQALMEKLLEQEALMEQQDPKVRRGQGLRWPRLSQQGRGANARPARMPDGFPPGLGSWARGFVVHPLFCTQ